MLLSHRAARPLAAALCLSSATGAVADRGAAAEALVGALPRGAIVERAPAGSLYVSIARDVGGPFPAVEGYWCRDWKVGRLEVVRHAGRVWDRWLGCRLPAPRVSGDFDLEMEYTARSRACDVRTTLVNRMDVGVFDLRCVHRIAPSSTPDSDRTYALFGMDEWIRDPVRLLVADRVNRRLPTAPTAFIDEGPGRGLYRNRCSPRPMISIHTAQFGLMAYDLDPDNAAPGSLLVGSNDGALEFGWSYRPPGEHLPGNGRRGRRIQVGPVMRLVSLPGRAATSDAWWDALRAYKAHARRAGLLPAREIRQRRVPADWARDSLSLVVNVGMPVAGDPRHRIDPGPASEVIRGMARFYRATGQRRFTPMLWGWSAVGPYKAPPGFDELLARLRDIEKELDVEIRPAVYMHGCMLSKAVLGTPLEACLMRDLRGRPFTWGGDLYNARADHPAFVAEIERTVRDMVRRGVRGFYFDAPFGEEMPDYRRDGVRREHHAAIRRMLQRVERLLDRLGGGVICHEAQRLGLPGFKGAAAPTVPGAAIIPFTEALYHETEVPIFFGDLAGQTYSLAAADARSGTAGDYEADDDIVRMAIEGAVYGRSGVLCNGLDRPYYEMRESPKWSDRAMYRMAAAAMPNALRARREHRELVTGRILPCPNRDVAERTVRHRPWVYVQTPTGMTVDLQPEVIELRVPLLPAALYEDRESAGRYLLVVGNPGRRNETVRFDLEPSDLPATRGDLGRLDVGGAKVIDRSVGSMRIVVDVAPADLTCVSLRVRPVSPKLGRRRG